VSVLQTVKAVAWSFFGVRRSADWDKDAAQLRPLPLIAVGLVAALLFVLGLMFFVRWVVAA
jgi:Protein of unknown function (DUF2970)